MAALHSSRGLLLTRIPRSFRLQRSLLWTRTQSHSDPFHIRRMYHAFADIRVSTRPHIRKGTKVCKIPPSSHAFGWHFVCRKGHRESVKSQMAVLGTSPQTPFPPVTTSHLRLSKPRCVVLIGCFWVWCLGFREGLGFRVQYFGFGVWGGSGFRRLGFKLCIHGSGSRDHSMAGTCVAQDSRVAYVQKPEVLPKAWAGSRMQGGGALAGSTAS